MGIPGEYYERGLLHPLIDYEQPMPWLNALDDPMDDEGSVLFSGGEGVALLDDRDLAKFADRGETLNLIGRSEVAACPRSSWMTIRARSKT